MRSAHVLALLLKSALLIESHKTLLYEHRSFTELTAAKQLTMIKQRV
jgi:hypothetical protein